MKHRNNRLFWTAAGALITGDPQIPDTSSLPEHMRESLELLPDIPPHSLTCRGEDLQGKRGRYIYQVTWKALRELGFSRPLRTEVLRGVEILIPFHRQGTAVIPQGFQSRVPHRLRSLALIAKSAVLREAGFHLVVCSAVYMPEVWNALEGGRCSVCTPDNLTQLVNTLDFSR
ncbi:MAG TPA: hypothetical protein PK907_07665, partial [Candidatus Sabulitectum sp.]|nr:hypothetical protein [Candidatus Sabulitectum sp.]